MFRPMLAFALACCVIVPFSGADDKKPDPKAKETTLEGKLVCTKCELQETKKCGHCLVVTEKVTGKKDAEVKYYLDDKGAKETYHAKICTSPKPAKVVGVVKEEKVKDKPSETRKVVESPKVEVKS